MANLLVHGRAVAANLLVSAAHCIAAAVTHAVSGQLVLHRDEHEEQQQQRRVHEGVPGEILEEIFGINMCHCRNITEPL